MAEPILKLCRKFRILIPEFLLVKFLLFDPTKKIVPDLIIGEVILWKSIVVLLNSLTVVS